MKKLAVMYSGGTDSTAAVIRVARDFDEVHLLTYKHRGITQVENSHHNVPKLSELFGEDKFVHRYYDIDRLLREVSYSRYAHFVRRYGFFNLTTCGLCKFTMHLRTLIYCIDHGITHMIDGANHNMSHFPAQMREVIAELHRMYARFGVEYTNPVFELDFPDNIDWYHKMCLQNLARRPKSNAPKPTGETVTTGKILQDHGFFEEENIKGEKIDRKVQPRCFQFALLNVFALSYYIPKHGMDRYKEMLAKFFGEKRVMFEEEVAEYVKDRQRSRLARLIEA